MCFVVPAEVIAVGPGSARVRRGGQVFEVTTYLLDSEVAAGDWLAVQAQRDAVAVVTEAEAAEMLSLYTEISRHLEEVAR